MSAHTTIVPRRRPRTPSATERVVGVVLLLVMAGLAGLFFVAGAGSGPAGLPEPAPGGPPGALPLMSPAGWPRGEIERYGADTLFEKINGKDAAYLAFDVVGLEFASYAQPAEPSVYADVYLYDMNEALNAFGVYRTQRTGGETSMGIGGDEATGSGAAIFARKGRHYLEVVGSGPGAGAEVLALARAILAALPAAEVPVVEPTWFPAEGRTMVRYARGNAMGMESLGDAWIAVYADGLQVVVARCTSREAAGAAMVEAVANFEFLGTQAAFATVEEQVVGVVGAAPEGRREALVKQVVGRILEGE